ncbi:MAG: hypothetical protein JW724_07005, partial [Candidatus Altiarchaeota archaeon]|nr:hypothetical protein [Candidatus Altiarchaeota archaeon]
MSGRDSRKFFWVAAALLALAVVIVVYAQSHFFDVSLNSPANNTPVYTATPTFNFTVTGSETCYNCTLFIDKCVSQLHYLYSCNMSGNCNIASDNCTNMTGCYDDVNKTYACLTGNMNCSLSSSDNCSDCSCGCGGYNETESTGNDNCDDGIDNDCDGNTDEADSGCDPCSCGGTGYENKTLSGDVVYVDCNADKCWTPTAGSTKTWGPNNEEGDDSCIGKGDSYPACDYCDDLDYGGFTDWTCPTKTVLQNLCDSGSCDGTCFGGDGF